MKTSTSWWATATSREGFIRAARARDLQRRAEEQRALASFLRDNAVTKLQPFVPSEQSCMTDFHRRGRG